MSLPHLNRNFEIVDVVLDPRLSDKMRAHQKEGVQVQPLSKAFTATPS